jgi:hypothetical protein
VLSGREPLTPHIGGITPLFAHHHREHGPAFVGVISDNQEDSLARFQYLAVTRLLHLHDR